MESAKSAESKASKQNRKVKPRNPSQIMETVALKTPSLQQLFRKFRDYGIVEQARLKIRFRILPDGSVTDIRNTGEDHVSDIFVSAVLDAMLLWKFDALPPGGQDVTVTLPFTFEG